MGCGQFYFMTSQTLAAPRTPLAKWIRYLCAGALLLCSQAVLNLSLRHLDTAFVVPSVEAERKLNPRLFETISFGHLPAAIDWLWIQSLIDPSLSKVTPGTHSTVYYHLDLATDLDPMFFEAYVAGGNVLSVIRDDFVGARDLLIKGNNFRKNELPNYGEEFEKRFWSQGWLIPVTLAYVYLFELQDMPKAAVVFKEAGNVPGAPEHLIRLAKRLEKPGGEYEVGLRLLNFLIASTRDVRVKNELQRKRDSLFISQYLFDVGRAFHAFLNAQKDYKTSLRIPEEKLQAYWRRFLRESRMTAIDPFGGRISIDAHGKITSTTPRDKVMGLD